MRVQSTSAQAKIVTNTLERSNLDFLGTRATIVARCISEKRPASTRIKPTPAICWWSPSPPPRDPARRPSARSATSRPNPVSNGSRSRAGCTRRSPASTRCSTNPPRWSNSSTTRVPVHHGVARRRALGAAHHLGTPSAWTLKRSRWNRFAKRAPSTSGYRFGSAWDSMRRCKPRA